MEDTRKRSLPLGTEQLIVTAVRRYGAKPEAGFPVSWYWVIIETLRVVSWSDRLQFSRFIILVLFNFRLVRFHDHSVVWFLSCIFYILLYLSSYIIVLSADMQSCRTSRQTYICFGCLSLEKSCCLSTCEFFGPSFARTVIQVPSLSDRSFSTEYNKPCMH